MRQNDDASATPLFVEALDIGANWAIRTVWLQRCTNSRSFPITKRLRSSASNARGESGDRTRRAPARRCRDGAYCFLPISSWTAAISGTLPCSTRRRWRQRDHAATRTPVAYGVRGLGHVARAQGHYSPGQPATDRQPAALCRLRDQRCVPLCLEGLACIAVGTDWAERATRLLGAANAFQKKTGAPAPPSGCGPSAGPKPTPARSSTNASAPCGRRVLTCHFKPLLPTRSPIRLRRQRLAVRECYLSPRERQVVALIAGGLGDREIAGQLVLSVRTVERHIENVYNRLGIRGKAGRAIVTAYGLRHHLIEPA